MTFQEINILKEKLFQLLKIEGKPTADKKILQELNILKDDLNIIVEILVNEKLVLKEPYGDGSKLYILKLAPNAENLHAQQEDIYLMNIVLFQLNTKEVNHCHKFDELVNATGLDKNTLEVICRRMHKLDDCHYHRDCTSITIEGQYKANRGGYKEEHKSPNNNVTNIRDSQIASLNTGTVSGNLHQESLQEDLAISHPTNAPIAPQQNIVKRIWNWLMTNPMITAIIGGGIATVIGTLILKYFRVI